MILYTAPMWKWKGAEALLIPFVDVTVKSGEKLFAPEWDFLMKYKQDQDEEAYIEKFIPLMRESYRHNTEEWLEYLNQEAIVIACYCAAGKFCHRHLLVDIFQKVCEHHDIPFEYRGELG